MQLLFRLTFTLYYTPMIIFLVSFTNLFRYKLYSHQYFANNYFKYRFLSTLMKKQASQKLRCLFFWVAREGLVPTTFGLHKIESYSEIMVDISALSLYKYLYHMKTSGTFYRHLTKWFHSFELI